MSYSYHKNLAGIAKYDFAYTEITRLCQPYYNLVRYGGDHCQNNPPYEIVYLVHLFTGLKVS